MLIFAFVSLPAIYLLLIDKVTYARFFKLFLGVLVSSIVSLLFWSVSTLYQPSSMTFISKFLKVFLGSVFPLLLLSLHFALNIGKKISLRLPGFSFVTGYLYWNLIFSVLTNSRRESDFSIIIFPLVFIVILYSFYLLNKISFKIRDNIYRPILYLSLPLLFVFTSVFNYYSVVVLIVFFVIVFALFYTAKKRYRPLINNLINFK